MEAWKFSHDNFKLKIAQIIIQQRLALNKNISYSINIVVNTSKIKKK